MRQRTKLPTSLLTLATLCLSATIGIATAARSQSSQPAKVTTPVTVASLVPSATDLLLGSGMASHLVAVSSYCKDNPAAANLPAVGDYQNTDWERLTKLRPNVLLVFMDRDRLPPGMLERAAGLGMSLEIVKVETVDDVFASLKHLGDIVGEPTLAADAAQKLHGRLAALRARVAGHPKVRTLIVLGDDAKGAIGPGGFLDELLTVAGGDNAASALRSRYPTVDTEQLLALAPTHIIHLLPGGTPAGVAEIRARWARQAAALPAAADVTVLTDWYVLQPGSHIADIAETFADALHGKATPDSVRAPDSQQASDRKQTPENKQAGDAPLPASTTRPAP